jgi:hypothetical protein
MMNERAQRTERAAVRLIKSMARRHVYMAMSRQLGGAAYDRMVMLEDAILEEAQREWGAIIQLWPRTFERLALPPIIEKSTVAAFHDCRASCETIGHSATMELRSFFTKVFEPQELVK